MSKFIEVKDWDAGQGNEFSPASYPGDGVYWNPRTSSYYFINGAIAQSVFTGAEIPSVSHPSDQSSAPESAASVDHLAMLAVVLHPEVAKEYIKKGGAA